MVRCRPLHVRLELPGGPPDGQLRPPVARVPRNYALFHHPGEAAALPRECAADLSVMSFAPRIADTLTPDCVIVDNRDARRSAPPAATRPRHIALASCVRGVS